MKNAFFTAVVLLLTTPFIWAQVTATQFANTITAKELQEQLYVYASDYFAGRDTGKKGQKIAVDFLRQYYENLGIPPAKGTTSYFQKMLLNIRGDLVETENVVAILPGTEKKEEYLILSAHLDHVGIRNGEVYNGADDNGSGTVALMEIAAAFKAAADQGHGPKRSIIFLHMTGEEKGLLGSKYYTEHPLYPLKNTIADLNVDMIGRLDPKRESDNENYIYLIGSDRLSQELHDISERINKKYTQLELDYTFNAEDDPNRFYQRSDHYNFAKKNIPIIFYFNGTHDDYHRATDTADKIRYPLLEKRVKLIFHTAWELANRENRPKLK